MHNIEVRHEHGGDEAGIRAVNDEAFGQPDESRIVDAVRRVGNVAISLVALHESRLVGHILFTPVTCEPPRADIFIVGLGPMAVTPEFQRQGIGSKLVEAGLRECERLGCHGVVVVGHPELYPRFGFRPASHFRLRCEYDVPDEVFMAKEMTAGALDECSGLVRYVPEFAGV